MTREALTILEGLHESIMQLRIKNYGIERELYDIDAQVSRAIDHLTALSKPFVPAKHLSGWVQYAVLRDTFGNGEFRLEQRNEAGTKWMIFLKGNRLSPIFEGKIKTAAFFLALCEALNIK